jgi:two-component system, chemotaxis family, response regulator Rcp1
MKEKIHILLVEDSPSDVRLTEEALKDSGLDYELSLANDGEEAMNFLHQQKMSAFSKLPHIILLDLNMPRKNGHEVLAEIKADSQLSAVPVVILTVSQQEKDIMEALRLKMNYYLCKPVDPEQLAALVQAIFELHKQDDGVEDNMPTSSQDSHIHLVLAGNPHTPGFVLSKLAQEGNPRVRCRVAENPATPADVLLTLAKDENADVRLGVSENPNVSKDVLEELAKDISEDVRMGMAANPNIPEEILHSLASDENIFVATSAAKTLSR